jgi:Holliday junction resolvase RusA-like endonuclease
MERFLLDFNSGVLSPDEATKFISHVGRATVYNWDKRHRHGGILALVPRYTTKSLAGRTIFWPLKHPFEIKLSGRPVRNGKVNFRARLKRHWKHHPLEGPISLGIFYSMPIPRGTKMQRRMKMLKHRISHIGKPNLDVLNAFVVDCLMGIVFKSHCQIINFHSEKRYAWWPEIKVLIRQLKG